MRIIIKATKIKLTEVLKDFIEEKIGGLERFLKDILEKEDILNGKHPRAEAFVEIGKPSGHHQKKDIFYAECQIPLPGKSIRAEAERENPREAVCEVKDELQRQLKKYKKSQTQKIEEAQRQTKNELHFSRNI